jgi:hypothetical protein
MSRRIAALTLVTVGLFGLTSCAGFPYRSASSTPTSVASDDAPGDSGQSTEQACELIRSTVADATADFADIANEEPATVIATMKATAQKLADVGAEITNDDVAALVPSLTDLFEQVGVVMEAIAAGDVSKVSEVDTLRQRFQDTTARFQELCGS